MASQPEFRLGNLHPAVQWAEERPEIDPAEHSKVHKISVLYHKNEYLKNLTISFFTSFVYFQIKVAFVRNLPVDTQENHLKQLFEPFGKVVNILTLIWPFY